MSDLGIRINRLNAHQETADRERSVNGVEGTISFSQLVTDCD